MLRLTSLERVEVCFLRSVTAGMLSFFFFFFGNSVCFEHYVLVKEACGHE